MTEKVSIIVPVYNVENYLDRCVNSIVAQLYPHLEIILVDDGSTDACSRMCDDWAEKDSRIRVIHKENQGLGMARNTGMAHATGEYLCFVDSDDYIVPEYVLFALTMAQEKQADMVLFGMGSADAAGVVIGREIPKPSQDVYAGEEVRRILLPALLGPNPKTGDSFQLSLSACRVLFSMELIRRSGWQFVSEREIISEDIYSMLALYRHVNRVAVLRKCLYFYCENNASLSRSYRQDRYEKNKHFYQACLDLCKVSGYSPEVSRGCSQPFLANTFGALKQAVNYHSNPWKGLREMSRILKDEVLQLVLYEKRRDRENRRKRIFYWAVRNRCFVLCYLLLLGRIRH